MTVINSSHKLSVKELYALTMNPATEKMKDHKGERIEIAAWAIYEDTDRKTGEIREILAIKTPEGETFATNSNTFKDDFLAMWGLFTGLGEAIPAIVVTCGTSKAGREFITCVYSD